MKASKDTLEDRIFSVLLEKGEIKASELEKEVLQKTGVVRSTFYRKLAKLVDKGIVLKERAKWKNSVYRLNPQAVPKERLEIPTLTMEITHRIYEEARKWKTEKELLEGFSSWFGALCLYVVMKKVRKPKPLEKIVEYPLDLACSMLTNYIMFRETPALVTEPDMEKWMREKFERHATGLEQYEEYREALKKFDDILKKMFSDQIEAFERIFTEVMEGKGSYKEVSEEGFTPLKPKNTEGKQK